VCVLRGVMGVCVVVCEDVEAKGTAAVVCFVGGVMCVCVRVCASVC
jgi:hypothetical protein